MERRYKPDERRKSVKPTEGNENSLIKMAKERASKGVSNHLYWHQLSSSYN